MPRIRRIALDDRFKEVHFTSLTAFGERNDCTVKALALVANIPYDRAHALLAPYRQKGRGLFCAETRLGRILMQLGFEIKQVQVRHFIDQYPASHRRVLQNVTTHHPRRFNKVWRDGHNYMLFTPGHVAAVLNGDCVDWSDNKAMRVETIWCVSKVQS